MLAAGAPKSTVKTTLLAAGAKDQRERGRQSALMKACVHAHIDVVRVLLAGERLLEVVEAEARVVLHARHEEVGGSILDIWSGLELEPSRKVHVDADFYK